MDDPRKTRSDFVKTRWLLEKTRSDLVFQGPTLFSCRRTSLGKWGRNAGSDGLNGYFSSRARMMRTSASGRSLRSVSVC